MDFDDLKRLWQKGDKDLESALHLNSRVLQQRILRKGNGLLKGLSRSRIDYCAPVSVFQKEIESRGTEEKRTKHWLRWLMDRLNLGSELNGEELVQNLQAHLLRVLRRRRSLRG